MSRRAAATAAMEDVPPPEPLPPITPEPQPPGPQPTPPPVHDEPGAQPPIKLPGQPGAPERVR
jgi:hypothetical protein